MLTSEPERASEPRRPKLWRWLVNANKNAETSAKTTAVD
jgi:hypothetical protein